MAQNVQLRLLARCQYLFVRVCNEDYRHYFVLDVSCNKYHRNLPQKKVIAVRERVYVGATLIAAVLLATLPVGASTIDQEVDARITFYSTTVGTFRAGERVSLWVSVQNTGSKAHTFFIEYAVLDESGIVYDMPYTPIYLVPGSSDSLVLRWEIPAGAAAGSYDATVAVWNGITDSERLLTGLLNQKSTSNAFMVASKSSATSTILNNQAAPCSRCPSVLQACPPVVPEPICPARQSVFQTCPPIVPKPVCAARQAVPPCTATHVTAQCTSAAISCTSPGVAKSVDENTSIQLRGAVTDEDSNVVEILWQAEAGLFSDPRSLDSAYCAPTTDRCDGEDVMISLTAHDSCGATTTDCFLLHINNVNQPPLADAGPDITVDECGTIELTCTATDPDGDPLTYYWTDESARGVFDDPNLLHPCYVAPATNQCEGEHVVLKLTVTDSCGLSASDSLCVRINNINKPPVVEADP